MILAYHAIFTTYGTWLPNDPRGSFSKNIYNEQLKLLGEIKYGRQYPQASYKELLKFWADSTPLLKRPQFLINDNFRSKIADAFGKVIARLGLKVSACAIMNNHDHILTMRSKYRIEYLVNQFKGAATKDLNVKQTPWARGCWKVFINDTKALSSAINYIESNPIHSDLPPQKWNFITPLKV
jgi:REP element-mobilizing transposase RayT